MKTDRELLELAAKAIGLELKYNYLGGRDARQPWNPLEDDGDALRLAVKLKMQILIYANCVSIDSDYGLFEEDFISQSPGSATRSAITRAAAEIGAALDQTNGTQTPSR